MNKQLIRKNKLSLSLALALGMGAISGTALAQNGMVLDNNDGLGDAGIFQYFTVNGNWQTFIRLINTSSDAVAVKVRFREAANSREILDFIVFLSPYDMWVAWTDAGANGLPLAGPGIRTNDTSCLFPDSGNTGGQGWIDIANKQDVRGIAFQDFAFTGDYYDNNTMTSVERMSEGHIEVIGISRFKAKDAFSNYVSHASDGYPDNCQAARNVWMGAEGDKGEGFGNVLALNGYLINVGMGQGAGYDPDIIRDFVSDTDRGGSLWFEQSLTATDPDFDSGDTSTHNPIFTAVPQTDFGKQKGKLMDLVGAIPVTGSVDAVSSLFMRASVINEWAASENLAPNAVINDYYSQWVVTFPTKHYYVDLDKEMVGNLTDDISPTLDDTTTGPSDTNSAQVPFYQEFDWAGGQSCEPYRMRMWNREERFSTFTSPQEDAPAALCYETNVVVFNQRYLTDGLNSNFSVTVPADFLPTKIDNFTPSERGWASMDFYEGKIPVFDGDKDNPWVGIGIGREIEQRRHLNGNTEDDRSPAGLPVTGFMFSVFNTNDNTTNHTTVNAHKYRRDTWDEFESPLP